LSGLNGDADFRGWSQIAGRIDADFFCLG
jgi:hypothetical protein